MTTSPTHYTSSTGGRSFWRILGKLVPIVAAPCLLWILYRGNDWQQLFTTISHQMNYGIFALSLVMGLSGNVIRGWRWHLLMKQEEAHPKRRTVVWATLGTYAVNLLLPRAGEVWRCASLKKKSTLPFSFFFGTVLMERLIDLCIIVLLLGLLLLSHGSILLGIFSSAGLNKTSAHSSGLWATTPQLVIWIGVGTLIVAGTAFWLLRKSKWWGKLRGSVQKIVQGFKALFYMKQKFLFVFYTICMWICYFLYFYITFFAFPFTSHLPIDAAWLAFALSTGAIVLPVQGGIGPWHFAVITALLAYQVTDSDARNFALIVHTLQTAWLAIVGILSIFVLHLYPSHRVSDTGEKRMPQVDQAN